MKNFIIVTSMLILGHSIAYADEEKICQTDIILQNKIVNSSDSKLIVNLENQGDERITWQNPWQNIEINPYTQNTMSYPREVGEAPQSKSLFIVSDNKGGQCTFSPWIIANCDVVFDWNCGSNTAFTAKFIHLKRIAQKGPWIIQFINN